MEQRKATDFHLTIWDVDLKSLGISRPGPSMPPTKCLALNNNCSSKVPTSTGTTLASLSGWTAGSRPGDSPGQHSISAHDPPGGGPTLIDHHRALPLLYEDAQGMIEYVSQGLHDATKEAAVLLTHPAWTRSCRILTRNADRVFYFDEGQKLRRSLFPKVYTRAQKS